MAATHVSTRCCVVGGGPAGMMLGFLLARAGVETVVLEKHGDFLRDFRGDTIHPSTLELMHELGLLDEFLKLPHQKVTTLSGQIGDTRIHLADFSRIPTHCKFIALMPQWNFLNFMAEQGRRYRTFDLRMKANATGLIESGGRVVGVSCETPDGPLDIRADLVVGAALIPGAAAPKLVSRATVSRMRPGSVVVDVAIDQGGCFETSRPTTHRDPVFTVDGIVHYCVANMPGAVPRTSTYALNRATLPFVLALANGGIAGAHADAVVDLTGEKAQGQADHAGARDHLPQQFETLAREFGAIPDAFNDQHLLEAARHAFDHVIEQCAGQAVQGLALT